ncbi:TonB-dependent receptor [Hyphomicrobium sp.]|uniref:TonB-dependent receptor n=1 Tax=Hyphomicrobium sp. TaxID=82 RepID=UPI002E34EF88|nr:TonB-dependent receptor [Hyphomicrobium sp.]HEX2840875.1 TonB-dependent receptor [Hyphomicrobium sp.]
MSLGDELSRGWVPVALNTENSSLGAVSLGLASVLLATSAGAQEAAKEDATPLPPLEVTAKKAQAKKAPAKKSTPAPAASPAPVPPSASEPSNAAPNPDAAFTPSTGNSLEAGTGIGRLPGSVQDQPQVVNVVSQQQQKEQNTNTVEQTLRNVPGVTVAIGEGGGGFNGDQFRIRGFEAKGDLYVDGLRDFGVYVRDSFATEEVQVLKGPASESFGAGTTGGVINLRQKTAHLGDANSVDFSIGTDNMYRAIVDINKQVNATTAMRGVALYHDQDMPDRDHVESERWGFLGSIGLGLGTDTVWTLNYLHQSGERTPDYGVPSIVKSTKATGGLPATELGVPRSSFYGRITDHDETDVDIITSKLQHRVNSGLTFFNDTRLAFYQRDFSTTGPTCTGTCADSFLNGGNPNIGFSGGNPTIKQDSWGFQNVASALARFQTGGLKHEAVAGIDVFYQEDDRPGWGQINKVANTPIRNPGIRYTDGYDIIRNPANDRTSDGLEIGLFASDRVWFTPELSVLAGVRWTTFDYNFNLRGGTPTIPGNTVVGIDGSSEGDYWSPKVSLIWEPTSSQTYYVSWSRAASPVGQFVTNSLNPIANNIPQNAIEENESWEAGAKWSVLSDRLGLTAAVFQVEKNGVVTPNPDDPGTLIQTGESQRVRGVEFGIAGQVTRAWVVQAGYTYLDSEITASLATNPVSHKSVVGNEIGGVPDSAFSIWTTYNLSESLISGPGKWTIGGGILYQSDMFAVNNSANQYIIPELFSLDAMLAYELDGWRLAVNGYNLTDELNYDASFNNRATPSAGRSAIFSVGKKF